MNAAVPALSAGSSSSPYAQSGQMPLQRHAQFLKKYVSQKVVQETHPFADEPNSERQMSHYGSLPKTLGERVSAALKRRLFPSTNLTRKQLQDALKCSVGTMDNLLSGNHDPSGRILDGLVAMFRETFVNEVWGAHNIHCLSTLHEKRVAALRKIEDAQEELRALG